MIIETPRGTEWRVEAIAPKLARRAELPGARVFDLAADALRRAKEAGMPDDDRLILAFPASWLVNSPAISRVLRRWALPPQRDLWRALLRAVDAWSETRDEAMGIVKALGDEPYAVEAISKILALLAPDVVPLMPAPARAFVLGDEAADARAFAAMVDWFVGAVAMHREALAGEARAFTAVALTPAQVLDRLLWYDSEGHRHFTTK